MYRLEDNGIVNGLSRGSRIVLGCFSAVCGVEMVVVATPKAPGFYLVALICQLLCIACIGRTKVRQMLGSCVGTTLFAGSLRYGYASFAQPAFFNALVLFVVFGLPGAAYALVARFGFRRKSADAWAALIIRTDCSNQFRSTTVNHGIWSLDLRPRSL